MAYTFAKYILCDFPHVMNVLVHLQRTQILCSEANCIINITLQEVTVYIPYILLIKNTVSKQSSTESCRS